ncbi:hypothetical protein [Treponema primitia]|uniref:hypothetical protein n=1 Tax=Treponema primitia TaxID=88058 RepID=UPI0002555375|nr:hypothetical protein [Treponema primitia]
MSNTILLIFEGEKTELDIFRSIEKNFFAFDQGATIIRASFKGEIYQLWERVKDDNFLDIVEILKERDNSDIKDLTRRQISEVHLFFDHDAHSHSDVIPQAEYNSYIEKMLQTFNSAFDRGKLWISYPMAEAIKHCKKDINECFHDSMIAISENTKYKELVNNNSDFQDIKKLDNSAWYYLTAINIQRTYCLVNSNFKVISNYEEIKEWFESNTIIRLQIHENQVKKFIIPKSEMVALSPFPLFLLNYFGSSLFNNIHCSETLKNCSFFCYQ